MTAHEDVSSPREWVRVGRGKELQFFATDQDIEEWLSDGLASEYQPYEAVEIRSDELSSAPAARRIPLASLANHLATRPDFANVWLRSRAIPDTFKLEEVDATQLEDACACNGYVILQHGLMFRGKKDVSRIAIIEEIAHAANPELRIKHAEYRKVFRSLARRIEQGLAYGTVWTYPDGRREQDDRLQRWTEGAVREAQRGVIFVNAPGRRLK